MYDNYAKFLEETVEQTARMMSRMCHELRITKSENEVLASRVEALKAHLDEVEKKLKERESMT